MIPEWLTDKLATPPDAGAGIHAWLFSVARQLHAHMDAAAVEAVLGAAVARSGRRVPGREIRDAVQNSLGVAWAPGEARNNSGIKPARIVTGDPSVVTTGRGEWPKLDPVARACRIVESSPEVPSLYDLFERSPIMPRKCVDDWIDWLFPDAEWLCLAQDHPATARSRRPEKWTFGPADECSFIVPSPMTGPSGRGLDGKLSHRCLDNTGPRRWLVLEFDSGTMDEQAALHWHFRAACIATGWPRLRLCVLSGGKSLHGWYGPVTSEEDAYELMYYAAGLGADVSSWNRAALMRLPGGVRTVKPVTSEGPDWAQPSDRVRQEVIYFEPEGSSQHSFYPR